MLVPRFRAQSILVLAVASLLACTTAPPAGPAPAASERSPSASAAAPPAAPPVAAAPTAVQALNPPVALKGSTSRLIGEAVLFDAIEKGYFHEEGIEVELIPFRSTAEQTPALATGEIAFGSAGPDPSFFNAVARGIPLKIVAYNAIINPRDTSGSWMVRQDHLDSGRYKGPSDMKGWHVALNSVNGPTQVWLERILGWGGLTTDDVQVSTLPFPDIPAAFANRAIDAAYLVEPFVSVAEGQGAAKTVLASGEFFFPGTPIQVVAFSPVFAEQQPEAAKRFLVAYLRGARDFIRTFVKREGGRDEFDRILLKYTPIQDPTLFDRMATHDMDPNGTMDPTVMNELQEYFVRYGAQQQKVDLSKVIDSSYAEYAVSRIGRVNP
jgi:NitT/TauT family transport system substrate-binding protein